MADEDDAVTIEAEQPQDLAVRDQSLTAKVQAAIKPAGEQRPETLTIAAGGPGQVLPVKFYEGASQLKLTDTEWDILKDSNTVPDEDIDIRPDGLIYASHMFYRAALTRVFGPGQWSLIPSSNAQTPRGDSELVYQAWVLVARGCYIGEAVGSARYLMSNPRRNWADALETTRSDAISKICAKTLGIGVNPWSRRFAREWRKKYAIQVWVNSRGQKEKRWRRIDDDPFENEDRVASKPQAAPQAAVLSPPSAKRPEPAPSAAQASAKPAEASKPPSAPKATEAPTPPKPAMDPPTASPIASPVAPPAAAEPTPQSEPARTTEQMVAENNIRLFIVEARRRKLIVGEDAGKALEFLVDKLGLKFDAAKHAGRTQIEIVRMILKAQTWRYFCSDILPKLREVHP